MKKQTIFWAKHHEILYGGSWVNIGFWKYIFYTLGSIVTCISKGYPPKSKDRKFGHSAPRKEYVLGESHKV